MTKLSLPAHAEALSLDLLNAHLAQSHNWAHGPFQSIDMTGIKGMDSMSGSVYRIQGRLVTGDSISLITKLRDLADSPNNQRGAAHEVIFYNELAEIAGIDSPEAYVALYDDDTHRLLLVLEYLEDGEIGTIRTNWDVQQIERVTSALAGMHARWWNSDELANLSQVRTFEDAMAGGAKLFASGVFSGARFLEKYGDQVHPRIYDLYKRSDQWGHVGNLFSDNRTLCNYDVAAKNLFLPNDPNMPPKFFDWSLLTRGSIGIELAVILAYSLHPDEHHLMPELLDSYLDRMHVLGVSDLTRETLWNDFRCGLLIRLAAPIALASRDYPPAHELALEILPRITSAVLETNALELLE
jgi:hypothetical protein